MSNNNAKIVITPLKPILIEGVAQKLIVLVRVQAPDVNTADHTPRKPYHLALTLDRSGSMSGLPLSEALLCAKHIINRLNVTDVASVTVFDDRVHTLIPARPIGDRQIFHQALAMVHSGGATNLYGGWRAGANTLLPDVNQAALARVLLLSDGNANAGKTTNTEKIAARCAEWAELGISTSTYGLGKKFNEDLMVEMAKRGGGNHYYGETAADLYEPFSTEFDLISNLYARHVKLTLRAKKDVKIKLLNDYPVQNQESHINISMPDIAYGAEAWALLEIEISKNRVLEEGCELFDAHVSANSPEGLDINCPDQALFLKAVPLSTWNVILEDSLVKTRQAEVEAGIFLTQLRNIAEQENWETIALMIENGRVRFAEYSWVMEVLDAMNELASAKDHHRFRKEALYSSRKMSNRLSAKSEILKFNELQELESASYLRRKPAQGKAIFELRPEDES